MDYQGIGGTQVYRDLLRKPVKKSHAALLDLKMILIVCKVAGNNLNWQSTNARRRCYFPHRHKKEESKISKAFFRQLKGRNKNFFKISCALKTSFQHTFRVPTLFQIAMPVALPTKKPLP
jgi:hypothetical protein